MSFQLMPSNMGTPLREKKDSVPLASNKKQNKTKTKSEKKRKQGKIPIMSETDLVKLKQDLRSFETLTETM